MDVRLVEQRLDIASLTQLSNTSPNSYPYTNDQGIDTIVPLKSSWDLLKSDPLNLLAKCSYCTFASYQRAFNHATHDEDVGQDFCPIAQFSLRLYLKSLQTLFYSSSTMPFAAGLPGSPSLRGNGHPPVPRSPRIHA